MARSTQAALAWHAIAAVPCRFGVTNSEFDDLAEAYQCAATQLGPPDAAGAAFIERVLQPFAQARYQCHVPQPVASCHPLSTVLNEQAYCELRSRRVGRGASQRACYHLCSLARFLEAGRAFTAELRPVALLVLVLHAEQR